MPHRPTSIYICCDPTTNEARYVGKTVDSVSRRIKQHLNRKGKTHRNRWFAKVVNPLFFVVEVVPAGGDWAEAERFWIEYLRFMGCDLVNSTSGGEGLVGYKFTPEQLERVKAANRLSITPERNEKISRGLKGGTRVITPEWRNKIAESCKGRTISQEHRDKISATTKGRESTTKMTAEIKAKISATKRANPLTEEERAKRSLASKGRVISEETRDKIRKALASRSPEAIAAHNAQNSAKNKGHKVSEETRRKISEAHAGRVHTEQSRMNMSIGQKSRKKKTTKVPAKAFPS